MATRKLSLAKLVCQCRLTQTISSSSFSASTTLTSCSLNYSHSFFKNPSPNPGPHFPSIPTNFSFSRSFSTGDAQYGSLNHDANSVTTQSEFSDGGGTQIGEAMCNISGEDSIIPVRALISLLDGYHDLTGLPWWIIIGSSTLALRMALFPLLILQLNKLKRIAEFLPKLPSPLPPPLSERSYKDQFMLFWNERRAVGCPSFLWLIVYVSIQFPCFLLWMTTIRRMSLDHHTGFDCGGTLWFKNLTELPHGYLGTIFPVLIAGLHFVNVQVSFQTASAGKASGLLGFLVKSYKLYLDVLTLPLLFVGFCIPQGTPSFSCGLPVYRFIYKASSVYWLTNSSLTFIQQLCLKHPHVRNHLGLPEKVGPVTAPDTLEIGAPVTLLDSSDKQHKIFVRNRSPHVLVILSLQLLGKGHREKAVLLLRQALDKDPEHVRALIIMGQTLLQDGLPAEATEYLERAISRLFLVGQPTEAEEVDLLIVASQWAGSCYIRQGKYAEAMIHFERLGRMKEPEDVKGKAHYYDGLVMLASALTNEGRKAEAAKYLRMAIAYDPAIKVYLEQLENEEENFASDLVNSRRGDY